MADFWQLQLNVLQFINKDLLGVIYTDSDLEKVEGTIAPLQPQFYNSLLGIVYV